jgi:hypothetical protein
MRASRPELREKERERERAAGAPVLPLSLSPPPLLSLSLSLSLKQSSAVRGGRGPEAGPWLGRDVRAGAVWNRSCRAMVGHSCLVGVLCSALHFGDPGSLSESNSMAPSSRTSKLAYVKPKDCTMHSCLSPIPVPLVLECPFTLRSQGGGSPPLPPTTPPALTSPRPRPSARPAPLPPSPHPTPPCGPETRTVEGPAHLNPPPPPRPCPSLHCRSESQEDRSESPDGDP